MRKLKLFLSNWLKRKLKVSDHSTIDIDNSPSIEDTDVVIIRIKDSHDCIIHRNDKLTDGTIVQHVTKIGDPKDILGLNLYDRYKCTIDYNSKR